MDKVRKMMRSLIAAALAASASAVMNGTGTVYFDGANFNVSLGVLDCTNGVACGSYIDMSLKPISSFGELSITTNNKFNDSVQMFAAGFLEGALTTERIGSHYDNMDAWIRSNFKNNTIPPQFETWFATQDAWARQNVAANASSPIWLGFGLVLSQFDGLVAGYNAVAGQTKPLSVYQMQELNAAGDWLDLIPALSPSDSWDWTTMSDDDLMSRVRKTTHCSALVKVNGDLSEMWFAHAAWFIFQSTTRIFKHYNFALANPSVTGQQMSFASYPAYLSSLDDYYSIWSSGITVLETTNSIFNMSLYTAVKPQSLLAWHRVRTANLLAHNGTEWAEVFGSYNSGTYNNQYIVVMVSAFAPAAALPDGLLTIVEQIPGLVVYGDATQELERGYFPSYNVPYFDVIYEMSGYSEVIKARRADGEPLGSLSGLDYQLAPRAKIFRRDQGKVVDDDSFLGIMRYNDFKNDPYAEGDPWNAICSRGDLASSPSPDGCLDGKAGTASMFPLKQTYAINGPTTGSIPPGGPLPPFAWTQFPTNPQEGLPPVYDFNFEVMTPAW